MFVIVLMLVMTRRSFTSVYTDLHMSSVYTDLHVFCMYRFAYVKVKVCSPLNVDHKYTRYKNLYLKYEKQIIL